MAFAITGGRYAAASVSSVGTTSVTVGTTPFVQADFAKTRMLGLWSSSQLVTNPGFDSATGWTLGGGVTISGGVLTAAGAGSIAWQTTPTFVAGRSYTISVNYNMTSGAKLRFGTGTADGSNVVWTTGTLSTGAGTATYTFVAASNTTGFYVAADGMTFSGTLDNFTVTENAIFKGLAWARRWVSTSQIELEKPFFDPATGLTATQAVGDQVLVSKDFAESVTAGLAVSGRVVSITDTCTFGIDGNQAGVCFYDENKLINATFGTLLSGGLTVFGKLDDYATNSVSGSIDVQSTNQNPILCNNAAVNFCGYGGRWESSFGPGASYFIGGNGQGTAGNTVVVNSVESPNDMLTNGAGSNWARNPTRHQLVNCYGVTAANNAILRRWGNGVIRGGQYRIRNGSDLPISIFGSDSAGTYTVAAPAGERSVVLDMGGTRPALVRASTAAAVIFDFTNLLTTDFRSVAGAANPLAANPNGINRFRFSDAYTGLQAGTVGVVLDNTGTIADSTAASGTSWAPSLLRRTCVGATITVNATSWTYGFARYGFDPIGGTIAPSTYDLGSAGTADNVAFGGVVTQLADTMITQANSATVAAYTMADMQDPRKLYDRAALWLGESSANMIAAGLGQKLVTRSGDTLDFGSRNVVFDEDAAQLISMTGNTVTVKALADTFTGNVTTTGTVTGNITGTVFDANNAGVISVQMTSTTDIAEMRKASDNSLIATRTGAGSFAVSPANVGVSVYFERKTGTALVMSTITTPVTLIAGVNPAVPLYAGAEVQVAQAATLEAIPAQLQVINRGVQKASLLIPHGEEL